MGRTIHYSLTTDHKFNKSEMAKLQEISDKYNTGIYKDVWTCENFYLSPLSFYPNWANFDRKKYSSEEIWKIIDNENESNMKKGMDYIDSVFSMIKKKLVCLRYSIGNEVRAFTKVQGNEYNSLLVYQALIEVSEAFPTGEVKIHDEGEFLLCDVILKNGKATPDLEELISSINYDCQRIVFKTKQINELEYMKKLDKSLQSDLNLNNPYSDENCYEWINEELRNLYTIQERVKKSKEYANVDYLCIHNISQTEFDPYIFTRKVDIDKFKDYQCSVTTLMDGFNGEGFGLTDKDAEQSSYEMLAKITKMFSGSDLKLEVLPKV